MRRRPNRDERQMPRAESRARTLARTAERLTVPSSQEAPMRQAQAREDGPDAWLRSGRRVQVWLAADWRERQTRRYSEACLSHQTPATRWPMATRPPPNWKRPRASWQAPTRKAVTPANPLAIRTTCGSRTRDNQ